MPNLSYVSREPVRAYLHSIILAVVIALVTLGWINDSASFALVGVATAVFAVPVVELARSKVRPVAVLNAEADASGTRTVFDPTIKGDPAL